MSEETSTDLSERPADGRTQGFVLEVISGPDAGRSLSLDVTQATPLYIGKSEACALALSDTRVSRRHAAVFVEDNRLRLTDAGSLNGTTVNGIQISDAWLTGGEIIGAGGSTLGVRAVGGPPEPVQLGTRFGRVLGSSPEMCRLYPLCHRLARSDVPVIIEGETGTGKELLAESIHEMSKRSKGEFVVFDCTAVPPGLVESSLFGHEKGAFTGAVSSRRGVFEQASGGTLLIDEIGDLELGLQSKLLRAIERSEVQRVGGTGWTRVDVRVLAATRRDLEREIQAGRFRDDLFYRLAVTRIEMPPLRRRTGDIEVLVRSFWASLGGEPAELTPELIARFESYSWPGNVRELHNAVAHRIALGDLSNVESIRRSLPPPPPEASAAASLPDVMGQIISRGMPFIPARSLVVAEFERRYCEWVLEKAGGNVTRAAEQSGLARRYFYVIKTRAAKT